VYISLAAALSLQHTKIHYRYLRAVYDMWLVWLGGVAVGRRIRDREVASSIPG